MGIRISKSDVIWNYLGVIMTLGSNLFLLPFVLQFLKSAELGLWYTFTAIGNIAILFDFGLKATMARNITYSWCGAEELVKYDAKKIPKGREPNYVLMDKLMKVTRIIYLIISVAALILLLSAGTVYIKFVSTELDFASVLVAYLVYLIGVFFNLYFGYMNSFLTGVGAIKENNIATVVSRALQLLVAFVMLYFGYGLISMAVSYCVFCAVFRVLSSFFFNRFESIGKNLKKYGAKLNQNDFVEIFKVVWHNAWRDGVVSFSTFLNSQATTLMCSAFLTLEATATYGLSTQIVNAVASVSVIYFSSFQSKMQELYIEREDEALKRRLSSTLLVYVLLFVAGSVAVCTVGIPLLQMIKSDTKIDLLLLIALFAYMFFYKNHTLFASYLAGTNRVIYTPAYVISSISMVVVSLLLLIFTDLGVWSLVIAPFAVESVFNNWHWPLLVMKELKCGPISVIKLGFSQLKIDFTRKKV